MWNDIIIKYMIYISTYNSLIEIIITITDIFNNFGNICVSEYVKIYSEKLFIKEKLNNPGIFLSIN